MDTVTIRNEIQRAFDHEASTHELAALLRRRVGNLHSNIVVHRKRADTNQSLLQFVGKFINRTPALLDTLLVATRHSQREELCEVLANTCQDFFACPPPLLSGRSGLNGVLAKSYFCHRLIEELNDYCAVVTRTPLLPLDITCSNLIVHHLIGEPFANLLDDLVETTVQRLQDITAPWVRRAYQDSDDQGEKVERLCRRHGLLGADPSPDLCIASRYFSVTIH